MTKLSFTLIAFITLGSAMAQSGKPNPDWCLDLGIFTEDIHGNDISGCHVDPLSKEKSDIMQILAKTDPYKFLPDELAAQVESCRKAREERNPLYSYSCRTLAPLRDGRLREILYIPKDQVGKAKLGKSGARVVVDCNGRHLQIRADLPLEKQLELIKQSFSTMLAEATSKKLAEKFSANAAGSKYQTCDLSKKKNSVKTFHISWHNSKTMQYVVWDEKMLPQEYTPNGCIPDEILQRKEASASTPRPETPLAHLREFMDLEKNFKENGCMNYLFSFCFKDKSDSVFSMSDADCSVIKVPPICDDLNSRMLATDPSKKWTEAENTQAYLTLALEKKAGSLERVKLLERANWASGKDKAPFGKEPNPKLQEQFNKDVPVYCQKNACDCFFGIMEEGSNFQTLPVGLFGVEGIEEICKKADLNSCEKKSPLFNSQETFCKVYAQPSGVYMNAFSGFGGDSKNILGEGFGTSFGEFATPPKEGMSRAPAFESALDLEDNACVDCQQEGGFLPWGE